MVAHPRVEVTATQQSDSASPPKEPPTLLRVAGLVTLVAMVAIDAFVSGWDPDPWVYLAAPPLIVWGPGLIPAITRR